MQDQISTRHRKVVDGVLETEEWTWGAFALNHTAHQISEMFRVYCDPNATEEEKAEAWRQCAEAGAWRIAVHRGEA